MIWEQLAADGLLASVIVDGHHLPAATVKSIVRAKGVERMILVTDATAAAGSRPGRYRIGDVECELGADGRVSLPGTAFLAGSSLTLDRAIANTARYTGLPIEDVIRMASQTSGELPRHRAGRDRDRRMGRSAISCCRLNVELGSDRGQTVVRLGLTDVDCRRADCRLTTDD